MKKLHACRFRWIPALTLLIFAVAARGVEVPIPVSPGSTSGPVEIGATCPTFSWALAAGSTGQELVIYRVGEAGQSDSEPVRRVALPGNVGSWTPPLSQCLEPGEAYAWSVRAELQDGKNAWSEAGLFQIASAPSLEEVEAALAVLERYRWSRVSGPPLASPSGSAPPSPPPAASATTLSSRAGTAVAPKPPASRALDDDALFIFPNNGVLVEAEDIPSQTVAAVRGLVAENTAAETLAFRAGVVGEVIGSSASDVSSVNAWGVVGITNGLEGSGVRGDAVRPSGEAEGVTGITNSPDGRGGAFFNNGGGVAVAATANGGTALEAIGSVVLKSGLLFLDERNNKPTCNAGREAALLYDVTLSLPCYCNGSSWRRVDNGGSC